VSSAVFAISALSVSNQNLAHTKPLSPIIYKDYRQAAIIAALFIVIYIYKGISPSPPSKTGKSKHGTSVAMVLTKDT